MKEEKQAESTTGAGDMGELQRPNQGWKFDAQPGLHGHAIKVWREVQARNPMLLNLLKVSQGHACAWMFL